VSDAPPPTADQIQPGFRWKRGARFRGDPDVATLYAELLETGIAHVDENPYLQHQEATIAALARRAAEDGFAVGRRAAGRRSWIQLLGPLAPETADPKQITDAAETHYGELCRQGRSSVPWSYRSHALFERPTDQLILEEIEWLATQDGRRIEIYTHGDIAWDLWLRDS
jgi:hypothetical protein